MSVNQDSTDSRYMNEALRLARKGMGWTNPNPMVGAVLVQNGKIIGRGYHRRFGFPHAEIEAFLSTKKTLKGQAFKDTTLYVNLEPCCHVGKTPPCTDVIIQSGATRVVCSILDPNPVVQGKGIRTLEKAGIDVRVGLLEKEARRLNEAFFTFHEKKRPFVAIKFAASLDGKIATKTGDSKWITSEKARAFSRSLRGEYQAVLVGINTVIQDDPHLGTRIKGKKNPIRIIIDPHLRIPMDAQVLRDSNVIIATTIHDREKAKRLKSRSVMLLRFDSSLIPIPELLEELRKRQIISILVEGGGETIGRFIDSRVVDKVFAFHAPLIIGGEASIAAVGSTGVATICNSIRLHHVKRRLIGDALLTVGYPVIPKPLT